MSASADGVTAAVEIASSWLRDSIGRTPPCGHAAAVAHMAAHARAVPSYVLKAMAPAHSGDPDVLDREEAWQRAHVPEGFAEFVYPAG
jgi:hypothetical protein